MIELRIKDILKEKGLTSKALAERLGKAPQYVNNVINGGKGVSLNTLNDIANELEVPVASLFTDYSSASKVAGDRDFLAIIKYNGELKEVTSVEEMERIVSEIKGK